MQALPANKAPNLAKVLLNFKPKLHFNADDSRQIVFKPGVGIKKRSEENLPPGKFFAPFLFFKSYSTFTSVTRLSAVLLVLSAGTRILKDDLSSLKT